MSEKQLLPAQHESRGRPSARQVIGEQ